MKNKALYVVVRYQSCSIIKNYKKDIKHLIAHDARGIKRTDPDEIGAMAIDIFALGYIAGIHAERQRRRIGNKSQDQERQQRIQFKNEYKPAASEKEEV